MMKEPFSFSGCSAVFDQMTSFWNDEKGDSDNVVTESESDSGADDQF